MLNPSNNRNTQAVPIVDEFNTRKPAFIFNKQDPHLQEDGSKWKRQWSYGFQGLLEGSIRYKGHIKIHEISKYLFETSNDNVAFIGAYNVAENKLYLHPLAPWEKNYSTAKFYPPTWGGWGAVKLNYLQTGLGGKIGYSPIDYSPIVHVNKQNRFGHLQILARYGFLKESEPGVVIPEDSVINNFIGFRVTKKAKFIINPDNPEKEDLNIEGTIEKLWENDIKNLPTKKQKKDALAAMVYQAGTCHVLSGQSGSLNGSDGGSKFAKMGMSGGRDAYLPGEWAEFLKRALAKTIPDQISYIPDRSKYGW